MTGEPIWVLCEGSDCPPAEMTQGAGFLGYGVCTMCGITHAVVSGVVLSHRRDDIIARLERGDFG